MEVKHVSGETYLTSNVMLLLLVLLMSSTQGCDPTCPPCKFATRSRNVSSYFTVNGTVLPNIETVFEFSSSLNSGPKCVVNFDHLYRYLPKPGSRVNVVYLRCEDAPLTIHINTNNSFRASKRRETTYVYIVRCSVTLQDIVPFAKVFNLNVLYYGGKGALVSKDTEFSFCHYFHDMKALAYEGSTQILQPLHSMLECIGNSSQLAEIIFLDVPLKFIPDDLPSFFPQLQNLRMRSNQLSTPPEFPWNANELEYPQNLKRTALFEELTGYSACIRIAPNIFKRSLRLDNNKITNLSDHTFHGYLHKLSLSNNGLSAISSTTFANLTGLQCLILSHNNLNNLPIASLDSMTELLHLDLSYNKFASLQKNLFQELQNLEVMDLSQNKMTTLEPLLFSSLSKLRILKLGHNQFQSFPQEYLQALPSTLFELHLDYNPISTIPVHLLYVPKLLYINLRGSFVHFNDLSGFIDQLDKGQMLQIISSSSKKDLDISKLKTFSKTVDLRNAKIIDFNLRNITGERKEKLKLFLKAYKILLGGNIIACDSKTIPFIDFMKSMADINYFDGKEYFWSEWRCQIPFELKGRKLLSVKRRIVFLEKKVYVFNRLWDWNPFGLAHEW